MKFKINKASDLTSISVLPPHSRRLSSVAAGPSQIRSQASQQSFSQGFSSQYGMFSQLSQSSLDEILTNDQRLSSQERENSGKKTSCLPQIAHSRDENQMVLSRPSSHLMRKWNPSPTDHKNQINEELEHRFAMIETSLTKFGRVLDSVEGDVMQVNKGTKEVSLEMEGIRQKLIAIESSLQLMKNEQENVKSSLDGNLKSISEQLSKAMCQDMLQHIRMVLSSLPQQMEASLQKLQHELCMVFAREMQSMACNLKGTNTKSPSVVFLPKATGGQISSQRQPDPPKKPALLPKLTGQKPTIKKVEMGGWNSVKLERATFSPKASFIGQNNYGVSSFQMGKQNRLVTESDEDIDGGFSCLINNDKERGFGDSIIDEATAETERILRKARRRKRKHINTIIID